MKATGIIRRIDDLGRIVIPKEIRKNLRLKNSENLEIFIDENENIILKKYNQINKLKDISNAAISAITYMTKNNVFITNTDTIIAGKKEYLNKNLSNNIVKLINERKDVKTEGTLEIIENEKTSGYYVFCPILASGDAIGMVIMQSETEISEEDFKMIKIIALFLAKYIEE